MTPIDYAAWHWQLAEHGTNFNNLADHEKDRVRERVRAVLGGEVRRSEYGKGDESIACGRYRGLQGSAPAEAGYRYWHNFYDCLLVTPDTRQATRLFGREHVGQMHYTNIQVGGVLGADQHFAARTWYARVAWTSEDMAIAERLAPVFLRAKVTLVVGDRPQAQMSLLDLLLEPHALDCSIPIRQTVSVEVSFANDDDRRALVDGTRRDRERQPFGIWLNLEGWGYRDDSDHDWDYRALRRAVSAQRKLISKVVPETTPAWRLLEGTQWHDAIADLRDPMRQRYKSRRSY